MFRTSKLSSYEASTPSL